MHTFIAGAGFSGSVIAKKALEYGQVSATRRQPQRLHGFGKSGINALVMDQVLDSKLLASLATTTHLIICVAPERTAPLHDPVLNLLSAADAGLQRLLPELRWIGYLSTIGVYGNHDGEWVDESTACTSGQMRSIMRREAEIAWQETAQQLAVPISVLRLSGIYGPGRNAVQDALNGRARMLIKPGQVFNRIHVSDLADATLLALRQQYDGVLNITDDQPAPPQDVIRFAHDLSGLPYPQAQDFHTADISDMARSFYSENKRVSNKLCKEQLGMEYTYPDYKSGLTQLWQALQQ